MATHLDLEEQEQLDQIKHFWKQHGNLITWVLVALLGAYAAWNGWNWYQRDQAVKAAAMYDELERAAQAGDADKAGRVFNDLKDGYGRTAYAQQGGLLAARLQLDKGQGDAARASLTWVSEHAAEAEYQTVARLRLAAVLLDDKKYDEALKQLDGASAKEFEALVADRRGDVLLAQGKKADAQTAYQSAYKAMGEKVEYRRLIDAKLTALGAAPAPEASADAASGAAK
jgi:predicted negative regulator of RcsB-dependent stress response